MENYLHALPFHKDANNLSSCKCKKQGFDPPSFKLYTLEDRLPTFVLKLPPIGANPDITYAKECVYIRSCDGKTVASITMEDAGISIKKDLVSYYIIYDGRKIPGLKMECGGCFQIKFLNNYSEVFWVTATPSEKVTLEFSNKGELGNAPYQVQGGLTQKVMLDGEICAMEAELFESRKSETNGKETVTFQRMTNRKGLQIFNAPDFIQQLISSARLHETFKVSQHGDEYLSLPKRSSVSSTENGCCDYDLNVVIPYKEINISGGVCQTDSASQLVDVEIPDDLPDSCSVDNDFEPTDTTLCLRLGELPPPVDPPIAPVGTPPLPPCRPTGSVISTVTQTVTCENAYVNDGKRYRKMTRQVIADGNCGEIQQVTYSDICEGTVTHTLEGITCGDNPTCEPDGKLIRTDSETNDCTAAFIHQGKAYQRRVIQTLHDGNCGQRLNYIYEMECVQLPPVGTPPVGTPPVGTPPVGTPPVGTPPEMSGIVLYSRNADVLTAAVGELPKTGGSFFKPLPQHDLATTGFNGVSFDNILYYYRQKVNGSYIQRYGFAKNWTSPQTVMSPEDASLFKGTNFTIVHTSILARQAQEWQIEMIARMGQNVVATKEAKFAFTIAEQSTIPLFGTFRTGSEVASREISYNKNSGLVLGFNADGSISDITPGLDKSQVPNRINGKCRFYMTDYQIFQNGGDTNNPSYAPFTNVIFPAGEDADHPVDICVRAFDCEPSKISTLAQFTSGISGYPLSAGVNKFNCRLSEVTISIFKK